MASAENTRQENQTYWKEQILAYQRSGLTKALYCRENDLIYHQFIYWAAKYAEPSSAEDTQPELRSSKLVPVLVAEPSYTTGLQLHLPNGVLISGISAQSVDMIGRVIEQL